MLGCVFLRVCVRVADIYALYSSSDSYPLGPIILNPGRLSVVVVMSLHVYRRLQKGY